MTDVQHQMIGANGTNLHVVTAGSGPAVVLLHGFPQNWYCWRHIIDALAPHYFVIAPDMRGMGDSEPCTEGQDMRTLARDVRDILGALDVERAAIVGHDWGGGVALRFVLDYPELVDALVESEMVYFPLLPDDAYLDEAQMLHSWYIFMQQDPWLPEQIADKAGEPLLRWFFEHGSGDKGSPFTDEVIDEYVRRFVGPRATAQFNLYRMMGENAAQWAADADRILDVPTLWISGEKDPFDPPVWNHLLPRAFRHLRVELLEGCGHWVPEEEPERLSALLLEFLAAQSGSHAVTAPTP